MGVIIDLITNSKNTSFYNELMKSFIGCKKFYFSIAFINNSGLQLLLDKFKELEEMDVEGEIITSTYLNFTEASALRRLKKFNNIKTKVYIAKRNHGFHTKGYIFEYKDSYKIIIGSSNLTQSALKSNIEWNVAIVSKQDDFTAQVLNEFNKLQELASEITEEFLEEYERFLNELKATIKSEKKTFNYHVDIKPNKMQLKAIKSLNSLRNQGSKKALVISATGTGKTYMSAFDVKQFGAEKVLFVVHRGKILVDAMKTFNNVIPGIDCGIYNGSHKNIKKDYLFASINTISKNKNLRKFATNYFDYIIIDEAHRSASKMYQNVLNYFKPKFLLGMTATPERLDNKNIFDNFDNNVAIEIRLREALEDNLVVPFHYFGITDVTTDMSNIDISKIDEVAKILQIKERVDFIAEKMDFYGFDGEKRKCLGFCVNIEHAKYMANEFNKMGFESIALVGSEASEEDRESAINDLEDMTNGLQFIFTVDIFNEGVDIPTVNLVLMLRPTQSPIIFTQQLGRGLRRHEEKEFLTVLDFIGNHKKTFLIPIALNGGRYYDKDALKVIVESEFEDIPGCSHIQLDRIAKENILLQLDKVKFNGLEYLKEEYFEFKRENNGEVPMLSDFLHKPMAPDPIKFINKYRSYNTFLSRVEKNEEFIDLDEQAIKFIEYLSKFLPLRRIHEFLIIDYVIKHGKGTVTEIRRELFNILDEVDDKSIRYAFKYLSNKVFSSDEQKKMEKYFYIENDTLIIDEKLISIVNGNYSSFIKDIFFFGIEKYKIDFKEGLYKDTPFKLYEKYSQSDSIILTNTDGRSPNSIREGVLNIGDDYFLFINLHKDKMKVKESQQYADEFISQNQLQWESQSKTSPESPVGQNLINVGKNKYKMHVLVRKYQKEKFIYLGNAIPTKYESEKPIRFQLELNEAIPHYMYNDFTRIVN